MVGDEVSANTKYALHLEKRICALLLKMYDSGQHISGVPPASIIATGTDSPHTRLDWSQLRVACIALNDIRACRQLLLFASNKFSDIGHCKTTLRCVCNLSRLGAIDFLREL